MKLQFGALAALAMVAAPLAAQGGGQGQMRMGGGMAGMAAVPSLDTLTAQLALTAEQQPQVAKLIATFEKDTKAAREWMAKMTESGDMSAMRGNPDARTHMTALRDGRTAFGTEIKKVLTAEQSAKYDELYPQRGGGRRGPGGGQ